MRITLIKWMTYAIIGNLILIQSGHSDQVSIENAVASCSKRVCSFEVTLKHADTGWDHYADHWRILDSNDNEIGRRTLYHPHVDEQPFTRRLANISIPIQLSSIWVEAHDKVHGYASERFEIIIPQ